MFGIILYMYKVHIIPCCLKKTFKIQYFVFSNYGAVSFLGILLFVCLCIVKNVWFMKYCL